MLWFNSIYNPKKSNSALKTDTKLMHQRSHNFSKIWESVLGSSSFWTLILDTNLITLIIGLSLTGSSIQKRRMWNTARVWHNDNKTISCKRERKHKNSTKKYIDYDSKENTVTSYHSSIKYIAYLNDALGIEA